MSKKLVRSTDSGVTLETLIPPPTNMSRFLLFLSLLSILSLGSTKVSATPFANNCPNTSTYTPGSAYKANLNVLLSTLSNATGNGVGFRNSSIGGLNSPDTVYGVVLCRGDVSTTDCNDCVQLAVTEIVEYCPNEKRAIIYYDNCLLRYSNTNIFSVLDESAPIEMHNPLNYTKSDPNRFRKVLGELMNDTATMAAAAGNRFKFATKEENVSNDQTIYGLSQCTPDLSIAECKKCLDDAISSLPVCCDMKQGGRYLFPSCNVRYELYPFYNLNAAAPSTAVAPPPPPPPNLASKPGRDKRKARTIAIGVSVSASLVVALVAYCIYCQRRKRIEKEDKENSQEVQLSTLAGGRFGVGENFERDKQLKPEDFPSIKLEIIHAATQEFSKANKLGEGGFGQVYKGTLPDGKEIAVKRLSAGSGQGFKEFKNEVTLIARLQHRNLVRLLGCCFEGNESLLIYEYMPNKSLDVFLFDPTRGTELDWKKRQDIINGIARGILYLHEDSRLRIIHRDLKTSNVLLDAEMNPKISDFGMARIFGENQNQANTNRVVGTYGYMSPEYAMHGQFSVKSDVFSFGVLLMEIISGKKNGSLDLCEHGYSLLTYAWKLWSEGEGLELLDPSIEQPCEAEQLVLMKCIHVGLLCVQEDPANRPTMSSVVVMLGSHDTVTFPRPTQPAFSVGRPLPKSTDQSSSSSNNNQLTLSVVLPR